VTTPELAALPYIPLFFDEASATRLALSVAPAHPPRMSPEPSPRTTLPRLLLPAALLACACGPQSTSGGTGGAGTTTGTSTTSTGTTGTGGAGGMLTTSSTTGVGGAGGALTTSSTTGAGGAGGALTTSSTTGSGGSSSSGGALDWVQVFPQTMPNVVVPITVLSVAVDGTDHPVIAGSVLGAMNFSGLNLTSYQYGSGYVARFDPAGTPLWAKVVTGSFEGAAATAGTNASGRVIVAASGSQNPGLNPSHILVLDPTGAPVWTKDYGSGGITVGIHQLAMDDAGRVVLGANTQGGNVDFGGGPVGGLQGFFVGFDAFGAYAWGKTPHRNFVLDAQGDVFAVAGGASFGCGPALSHLGKLDPAGNCLWAKAFQGMVPSLLPNVSANAAAESVIVVPYSGLVDFGCGPLSSASTSLAVSKFSAAGVCLWSKSFTGAGFALDAQPRFGAKPTGGGGWVVWVGFTGEIDFGGGPLSSQVAANTQAIAKLDTDGKLAWATKVAGQVYYTRLTGDSAGGVVLASSAADIDVGTGQLLGGNPGVVLARFSP
jgi:hypothetical protein